MELIKINKNEQGKNIVSARDLYLGLGLNKSHWKRWYKTNIENNEYFMENVDWVGFAIEANGNETKDFAITLDFAKHICMMAKTEKSHEYRNYLLECERKMETKQLDSYMIEDPIKRAKRWIEEQEQAQLLLEQKQQVIDTIVDDKTTFEQFNKQIVTIMNRICTQKSSKLSTVYNEFYYYLNMKMGINVILRVNNRREKLNNEYFKKTGKKYSEKTLKQKVTGLKVIKEEEYNEVLQIAKAWAVKLGVNIIDLNKLN